MRRFLSSSSRAAAILAIGLSAAVLVPLAAPTVALAQQQKQRTVEGKVTDKSDAPLKGAVVYLKDTRTLAVKSSLTGDDGTYRFGQLNQNTDYELWAVHEEKKSGTKTVSSFDSKNSFTVNLKIDK